MSEPKTRAPRQRGREWTVDAALPALATGALQGVSFNFADDIARAIGGETADDWIYDQQQREPGYFAIGNLAGALTGPVKVGFKLGPEYSGPAAWLNNRVREASDALLLTRWVAGLLKGQYDQMAGLTAGQMIGRAALNDFAAGAAYGAGGYEVADNGGEDPSALKVFDHAVAGGALGALGAAAMPTLARFGQRAALNRPTGKGLPPADAPLSLVPAALQDVDLRTLEGGLGLRDAARSTVDEVIARDEALRRMQTGGAQVFRTGAPNQSALETAGPNTIALFSTLSRDPEARAALMQRVGESAKEAAAARLAYLAPKDRYAGPQWRQQVELPSSEAALRTRDLLDALDDPDAHGEWLKLARAIGPKKPRADAPDVDAPVRQQEAEFLAAKVIDELNERIARASPDEALKLYERIDRGDLREKIAALAVRDAMPSRVRQGVDQRDAALRALTADEAKPEHMRTPFMTAREERGVVSKSFGGKRADGTKRTSSREVVTRRRAEPSAGDRVALDAPYRQSAMLRPLERDAAPARMDPDIARYMIDALHEPRRTSFVAASRGDGPVLGVAPSYAPQRTDFSTPATGFDKAAYLAGKALPIAVEQQYGSQLPSATGILYELMTGETLERDANASGSPWYVEPYSARYRARPFGAAPLVYGR